MFLGHWQTVFAVEQPQLVMMVALKWDHYVHLAVEYLMICVIYLFENCSNVNQLEIKFVLITKPQGPYSIIFTKSSCIVIITMNN